MSLKKSVFTRSMELAKMTIKLGVKELQSGNFKSRMDQALILTQSLTQLKGAAMKAGQLISIEMADYFPPEAAEILAQMQNNATAIPYPLIEKSLIKELGAEKLNSLASINQTPYASASIAQIHSAYLGSQKVALKVQHPGVAESIDSDLAILQKMANTFCKLTQREMDLEPLFEELKEVLRQEVDFIKEAELLKLYKSKLQLIKNQKDFYFTPTVIDPLSTQKVLTMSWEEGENLSQWIRNSPSQKHRLQLGHLILNLYCHEFFDWGLVQTDPNFSNFLIRNIDDNIGLVLLDFGSTRQYDQSLVSQYVDLLKSVKKGQSKGIIESAISFGLIDDRESEDSKQLFVDMMNIAIEPFAIQEGQSKTGDHKVFDFSNSDYSIRSQTVVKAFARSLKYSAPPHRIIFLHRKLGGIFALLKRLSISMDISNYWELMVENKGLGRSK